MPPEHTAHASDGEPASKRLGTNGDMPPTSSSDAARQPVDMTRPMPPNLTPPDAPADKPTSSESATLARSEGSEAAVSAPEAFSEGADGRTSPEAASPPREAPAASQTSDGGASTVEAFNDESPSPPSSASSREYVSGGYGAIPRRRRVSPTESGGGAADERQRNSAGFLTSRNGDFRDFSPIRNTDVVHRGDADVGGMGRMPYNDMPDTQSEIRSVVVPDEGGVWQRSSFVPVLEDESSELLGGRMDSSPFGSEVLLSQSRADLERARLATTREFNRRELREGVKDRFILGCSGLVMASVVFVIIVSGITTLLANRNFPQLEIYSDWPNGGIIPLKYGCQAPDGKPVSFPVHWRNVPRQATNLVLLFAHPGALSEAGLDPIHWFITDIPLDSETDGFLPANASANAALMPEGAVQHANFHSENGAYWPPCSTNGTGFFVVHAYAIDASAVIERNFRDAREVINRFVGVPVARLTGVYGKQGHLNVEGSKSHH